MANGGKRPRLQPPPRVRRSNGPDIGIGSPSDRPPASRRQRGIAVAVVVALVFGLLAVFMLLPSWQERRESTAVVNRGGPSPVAPTPPSPIVPDTPTAVAPPTPSPVPAPTATAPRSNQPTADRGYVEAMSRGLEALEDGQWQAAIDAFGRASELRPGTPEVADGLSRARSGQRLASITDGIRRAGDLERREEWHDAERAYSDLLALDPESAAALEGLRRSSARVALDERLEYYLANSDRLSTSEVFAAAESTLEEALETEPSGPRLESQISGLKALLNRASTPVAVILESDGLTDVVVYRVGPQGRFERRELSFKPGTYTVVGRRDGYRDIRLQLVVSPESAPARLVVRCTEPL